MSLYMGLHSGMEMPEDKVDGAWGKYKDSCAKLDLNTHKLYYNVSEGRAFCITEAPSLEKVQEAHDELEGSVGELEIIEVNTKD